MAVLVGVMVSGCAAVNAGGPARPAPVTPAVYASQLTATGYTLQSAFEGISSAPPLAPLAGQVDSATSAVRDARRRLATITPPPQYAADSLQLVSALDQLAGQLSELAADVRSQELCTAPSVMATLSTLPGADALRRAATAFGPAGASLIAGIPAPRQLPDRHDANGTVLRSASSGNGTATVENGTDHDAVVTLSQEGRAVTSLYVTRSGTAQMSNIPDGAYDVFFTSGTDWDGGQFTRSCAFQRFEATATFTTTTTMSEVEYTTYQMTLQPSPSGNARVVTVSPDSFPK